MNLQKSSLHALQLHSVVDAVSFMEPLYQQLPELRLIPLAAKGAVILGVSIGNNDFVNSAVEKELVSSNVKADGDQHCQKLVFHLLIMLIFISRYCANRKLICLHDGQNGRGLFHSPSY